MATDTISKLKALGLSDATIKNLTPSQQTMFLSLGEAITGQYNQNKTVPVVLTDADIAKLTVDAQNDPNINDFYKEQLRVGSDQFVKAVASLGGDYQAAKAENERQIPVQNKALAETEAVAGRAYSGFREQAQQKLKADQMSVIESSRRDLAKQLESAGSSFEQVYGTTNLPSTSIDTGVPGFSQPANTSYTPIGAVAGSQEQAKQADIATLTQSKEQAAIDIGSHPAADAAAAQKASDTRSARIARGYVYLNPADFAKLNTMKYNKASLIKDGLDYFLAPVEAKKLGFSNK